MATLNAKQRKASATYTDSKGAHFPMPDKKHARLALAMKSHAPKAEQPKIAARANRILGKGREKGR